MAVDRKEWLRRGALVLGFPIVVFGLAEWFLWMFDVAPVEPPPKSVKVGVHDADALHVFLKGGSDNRLVCLGGSTVAGAPFEHVFNMCTAMADGLHMNLVNLAGSAQDSSDILYHAKVACAHPMRMLYIYQGHNEFLHLERYAWVAPPAVVTAVGRFFANFRVYRLIQKLVEQKPTRAADAGTAGLTDDEVHAIFETNLRGVLDACKTTRVILSTVASNPDLAFPDGGRTLRETWRANGRFPVVAMNEPCRQCFRAAPPINAIIRKLAGEYASPNLVLVETDDLGEPGKGFERFWDHVHPKPAVHLEIARRTLAAAHKAGWIESVPEVTDAKLAPDKLRAGTEERAMYLLQYDPPAALKALEAIPDVQDRVGAGLTRALVGFVTDNRDLLERGLRQTRDALEPELTRAGIKRCLEESGEHRSCMHWRRGSLLNATERTEFTAAARGLGDDLLTRIAESL